MDFCGARMLLARLGDDEQAGRFHFSSLDMTIAENSHFSLTKPMFFLNEILLMSLSIEELFQFRGETQKT